MINSLRTYKESSSQSRIQTTHSRIRRALLSTPQKYPGADQIPGSLGCTANQPQRLEKFKSKKHYPRFTHTQTHTHNHYKHQYRDLSSTPVVMNGSSTAIMPPPASNGSSILSSAASHHSGVGGAIPMMAAPVGGAGAGVGAIAARDNNPLHAYQQQLQASQAALGQHPSYQGMRVADVID